MPRKELCDFVIVQNYLGSLAGEHTAKLVRICGRKRKPITDEEIEKKLPIKITEIRTILNRLHYWGIATYQKSRNPNTGWYSYSWEIKPDRISELIAEGQADEIAKIEAKIEYERNYAFFSCKGGCNNVPFEIAAEYEFKCPDCGKTMEAVNNEKRVKELKKGLKDIVDSIGEIKKLV